MFRSWEMYFVMHIADSFKFGKIRNMKYVKQTN